jgi:hypothetical protein
MSRTCGGDATTTSRVTWRPGLSRMLEVEWGTASGERTPVPSLQAADLGVCQSGEFKIAGLAVHLPCG